MMEQIRILNLCRGVQTVNSRIKELRQALGLSQREFGERLGVSRDVISNLEYGRSQPKEVFIRHLCQQYGVNEPWLTDGMGPMFGQDGEPNKRLEEAAAIFRRLCPALQDYALEQLRQLVKLQDDNT